MLMECNLTPQEVSQVDGVFRSYTNQFLPQVNHHALKSPQIVSPTASRNEVDAPPVNEGRSSGLHGSDRLIRNPGSKNS